MSLRPNFGPAAKQSRVLQDAGYPIAGHERGHLSRPRLISPQTPEIRFSESELDALLLAVAQAPAALPNADSLSSATLKLRALAESAHDAGAPDWDNVFDAWACGWKDYRSHEDRIALLIEAILRKRRSVVEYQKPSRSEPKTYDFDPYRLLFVGGGLRGRSSAETCWHGYASGRSAGIGGSVRNRISSGSGT